MSEDSNVSDNKTKQTAHAPFRTISFFILLLMFSFVILTTFAGVTHFVYVWLLEIMHLTGGWVLVADLLLGSFCGAIFYIGYVVRTGCPGKNCRVPQPLFSENKLNTFTQILVAVFIACALNWISSDLTSVFSPSVAAENAQAVPGAWISILSKGLILLGVLVVLLIVFEDIEIRGRRLQRIRMLAQHKKDSPRKILILAVSRRTDYKEPVDISKLMTREMTDIENKTLFEHKGSNSGSFSGDLEKDLKVYHDAAWNWWQMLRAIRPHVKTLKEIYLLGSADNNGEPGSGASLSSAEELIGFYLRGAGNSECKIDITRNNLDFEDFNMLTNLYRELIESITAPRKSCLERFFACICRRTCADRNKYKLSDIVIDATGAFKVVSIVAAQATLKERDLEFQYVETVGEKRCVYFNTFFQKEPESK